MKNRFNRNCNIFIFIFYWFYLLYLEKKKKRKRTIFVTKKVYEIYKSIRWKSNRTMMYQLLAINCERSSHKNKLAGSFALSGKVRWTFVVLDNFLSWSANGTPSREIVISLSIPKGFNFANDSNESKVFSGASFCNPRCPMSFGLLGMTPEMMQGLNDEANWEIPSEKMLYIQFTKPERK